MHAEKDATLEKDGDRYTLTLERHLAHAPETVWRVLTERDRLKQWFPCDVEGGWERGARLRFVFLHGEGDDLPEEDHQGEVLVVDEPRLLEFRWGAHLMRYELQPDGDGSLLRLSECFHDPSWGARNAAGWEMCLENVDRVLDGVAVPEFSADVWKTKFTRYVARFEPACGRQHDPSGEHPLLAEEGAGDPSGPTSDA